MLDGKRSETLFASHS